jgi:hypothetical protein
VLESEDTQKIVLFSHADIAVLLLEQLFHMVHAVT